MSIVNIPTGQYVFRNVQTGTYLNARKYIPTFGEQVVLSAWGEMLTNDRWNLTANLAVQEKYAYTYTLQSVGTLALGIPDPTNSMIVLGNDVTKQWILVPGSAPYSYAIQPYGQNPVLEPKGDSADNGTPVVLTGLAGKPTAAQSWFIIAADYATAANLHP